MKQIRLFTGYFNIYCIFLYLNILLLKVSITENINSNLNQSVPLVRDIVSTAQETTESQSSSQGNEEIKHDYIESHSVINSFAKDEKTEADVIGIVSDSAELFDIINNDTPIVSSHIDVLKEKASLLLEEDVVPPEANNRTLINLEQEKTNINTTLPITSWAKNISTDNNAEEIPSFSEWTQKHLDEIERKEQINYTAPNQIINSTKHTSNAKLRWKNYASVDCGAKVILANPDGKNSWAVLSPSTDEYKLDACNNRVWFIVELCEAIQLKKIEMANYELFSSSPKEFVVFVSDRFPTRDWSIAGNFLAKDERDVQGFDINTNTFGKYVKVEIKSHYGSEHYCPISLFRAYGISVFEVLQKEDPAHEQPIEDDDDDDNETINQLKSDSSGNLLSSATDAVLSMVKKAAQVLGNKVMNESSQLDTNNDTSKEIDYYSNKKSCICPSHTISCRNCSMPMYESVFELLSCNEKLINDLSNDSIIANVLQKSHLCELFGISFDNVTTECSKMEVIFYVFFADDLIGALCNNLAASHNKLLLNITYHYKNGSENIANANLVDIAKKVEKHQNIPEIMQSEFDEGLDEKMMNEFPTEPLNIEQQPTIISKATCSTETVQINPSKSSTTDAEIQHIEISTATTHPIEESIENLSVEHDATGSAINNVINLPEDTNLPEISAEQEAEVGSTMEINNGDENIEKIISEDLSSESIPITISSTVSTGSTLQGQKESVFLRLSNRIKALERNMSLSGQYLEELSKRYKKQVEEMQRILETMENTLKTMTKNVDQKHKQLEDKIESLTNLLEEHLTESSSFFELSAYSSVIILFIVLLVYLITKKQSALPTVTRSTLNNHSRAVDLVQRCNSVDGFISMESRNKKKRRPSDQALSAANSGDQEKQPTRKRKKSRHSTQSIATNIHNATIRYSPLRKSMSADWVESKKQIDDIPIPLEEADSSLLEQLPLTSLTDDVALHEIPCIFKTAASMRSSRNSFNNSNKKLEENNRSSQSSLVLSATESISTDNSPKKEKKGLKKFFKKVISK